MLLGAHCRGKVQRALALAYDARAPKVPDAQGSRREALGNVGAALRGRLDQQAGDDAQPR